MKPLLEAVLTFLALEFAIIDQDGQVQFHLRTGGESSTRTCLSKPIRTRGCDRL